MQHNAGWVNVTRCFTPLQHYRLRIQSKHHNYQTSNSCLGHISYPNLKEKTRNYIFDIFRTIAFLDCGIIFMTFQEIVLPDMRFELCFFMWTDWEKCIVICNSISISITCSVMDPQQWMGAVRVIESTFLQICSDEETNSWMVIIFNYSFRLISKQQHLDPDRNPW